MSDEYEEVVFTQNDNLVLVSGPTTSGKSMSLYSVRNDPGIWYANCEAGKKLPFKHKFGQEFVITDPMDIYSIFDEAENRPEIHTIVIDTLTYLMDMFESQYVIGQDGYEGWKHYQQYFKNLMQQYISKSTKNVIILAHTTTRYDEKEMANEVIVPIKGALKNNGIESYFSMVISTKRVPTKSLKNFENSMLNITEDNEEDGFKHVFQTRLTKDTINERIRGPMAMWDRSETYIDNDIGHVIKRLQEYYGDDDE